MKKSSIINIDKIRLLLTYLVVAIHIYPLSVFNELLDYTFTRVLFRIAVPIFLMITGYFILPKAIENKKILIKYTKKIIKLYLISILIFLPINFYNGYFNHLNITSFIKDILFNGTFYHLWYFPALIVGMWIIYFLLKKFNKKYLLLIVITLFIVGLFGDNYYGIIKNIIQVKYFYQLIFQLFDYTRNGLFFTPIFIYLGYTFNLKKNEIKTKNNILLIIIFAVFMILEGLILFKHNIPKHTSMYIALIPLVYYLFNLIIYNYQESDKNIRTMASWIYILHPLFIIVYRCIFKLLNLKFVLTNNFIEYIFVIFSTTIFVLIIKKVKEVINNGKEINNE